MVTVYSNSKQLYISLSLLKYRRSNRSVGMVQLLKALDVTGVTVMLLYLTTVTMTP